MYHDFVDMMIFELDFDDHSTYIYNKMKTKLNRNMLNLISYAVYILFSLWTVFVFGNHVNKRFLYDFQWNF